MRGAAVEGRRRRQHHPVRVLRRRQPGGRRNGPGTQGQRGGGQGRGSRDVQQVADGALVRTDGQSGRAGFGGDGLDGREFGGVTLSGAGRVGVHMVQPVHRGVPQRVPHARADQLRVRRCGLGPGHPAGRTGDHEIGHMASRPGVPGRLQHDGSPALAERDTRPPGVERAGGVAAHGPYDVHARVLVPVEDRRARHHGDRRDTRAQGLAGEADGEDGRGAGVREVQDAAGREGGTEGAGRVGAQELLLGGGVRAGFRTRARRLADEDHQGVPRHARQPGGLHGLRDGGPRIGALTGRPGRGVRSGHLAHRLAPIGRRLEAPGRTQRRAAFEQPPPVGRDARSEGGDQPEAADDDVVDGVTDGVLHGHVTLQAVATARQCTGRGPSPGETKRSRWTAGPGMAARGQGGRGASAARSGPCVSTGSGARR